MSKELDHVRQVWDKVKDISAIYRLLLPDIYFVDASLGQIQARLLLTADHVNSRKSIHGAVSAAVVDWAGGMAIATYGFEKTGASVDIHVSYASTATIGEELDIVAVADKVGNTLAFTSITITKVVDGQPGPVVATGSHTKFLPASIENRKRQP